MGFRVFGQTSVEDSLKDFGEGTTQRDTAIGSRVGHQFPTTLIDWLEVGILPTLGLYLLPPDGVHHIVEQDSELLTAGSGHRIGDPIISGGLIGLGFLDHGVDFCTGQGYIKQGFGERVSLIHSRSGT